MYLRCRVLIIILTHHFISLNKTILRFGNTQGPTHEFISEAHTTRLMSKFKEAEERNKIAS